MERRAKAILEDFSELRQQREQIGRKLEMKTEDQV